MPHLSGITQYLPFCDWLISLSRMAASFIRVAAGPTHLSYYSLGRIIVHSTCIPCFAYPFTGGQSLCCYAHFAVVNNASVNMDAHISLPDSDFDSFG